MSVKCYLISAKESYASIGKAGLVCADGPEEAWKLFYEVEGGVGSHHTPLVKGDFIIVEAELKTGSVVSCYDYYGPTLELTRS